MPLSISFGDFDTVCYSNQHNIIELINHAISITAEINIVTQKVEDLSSLSNDVSDLAGNVQDILDLISDVLGNVQDIAQNVSLLAEIVANHEARIHALEGG